MLCFVTAAKRLKIQVLTYSFHMTDPRTRSRPVTPEADIHLCPVPFSPRLTTPNTLVPSPY